MEGRRMRVDTTVVETNIHYPTDSSLLGDGVRVLIRTMKKISKIAGQAGARLRDRGRSVKLRVLDIARAARAKGPQSQPRLERTYGRLLELDQPSSRTSEAVFQGDRRRREAADEHLEAAGARGSSPPTRCHGAPRQAGDEAGQSPHLPRQYAQRRAAAERTDVDAFRTAMDSVGPRVAGLIEHLLGLDDLVNFCRGGISTQPLPLGFRQAGRGFRSKQRHVRERHSYQSFNTTTSMGRLTLNILLSFAQFEREVIGERIRDKFAASRKKGMWMGGFVPLGYDVKDRKLVVNKAEAEAVRKIFERFIKIGSATELVRALRAEDIRGKQGKLVDKGYVYKLLNNKVYCRATIKVRGERQSG